MRGFGPLPTPPTMLMPLLRRLAIACCIGVLSPFVSAQDKPLVDWKEFFDPTEDGNYWRLLVGPYTAHYHKDEEGIHEYVYLFGAERQFPGGWTVGAVYFSNSFGQSSGYFYGGERVIGWAPWPQMFLQWSVGLLYGYTEPYNEKVPFNVKGFSPGATIGLGWQFNRNLSMQFITLGAAGLMFQLAWDLR